MNLLFKNDPDLGCACRCGEYKQEVAGVFERNLGGGWESLPAI